MSYDLYLRGDQATYEKALEYLGCMPGYQIQGDQAWFVNDDTGVYFSFALDMMGDESEEESCLAFNLNYCRPSYFALEAEPHVKNLVEQFGFSVFDPQVGGMGEGAYSTELFFRGWNSGNEFGVSAIISQNVSEKSVFALPSAKLLDAWRWNFNRRVRQHQVGDQKFLPLAMFFEVDGRPATVSVWPDAAPIWTHEVDYFLILREQLGRKPLFGAKKKDHVLVSWRDVAPLISNRSEKKEDGIDLDYVNPPAELIDFVRGLSATSGDLKRLSPDQVLDEEIVAKVGEKT